MSDARYYGQQRPQTPMGDYNPLQFVAEQMVKRIRTAQIVKVQSITKTSEVDEVGMMDVQPLVNMLDGAGQISKHGTVYKIAYCRPQAGDHAIIMDPKVGDLGLVVMCDRDTTNVRKNKDQANPGSLRRFDWADGIWVMTMLGAKPKTYVRFTDHGSLILSQGQGDENNPVQMIVDKDYVQMQKKGTPALHVTVDVKNNQIVMGMAAVIAPNPYPDNPS